MDDVHDLLDEMMKRGRQADAPAETVDRPIEYADESLALRYTAEHADDMRYVHLWGRWLRWDGQRWRTDETLEAYDLARAVARAASAEICEGGGNAKLASTVASAKTVNAIVGLARADRRHATRTEDWDADPWLLNTPGGTVDLRTGKLRPHERADLITKITAVAPGGECPLWLAFLDRVFAGDADLIGFARRMLGYSLTGSIRDHALFFLYGTGGNGKGVFLNTWHKIMGDYSCIASMETFVASKSERHPTDLAMLRGARAVIAQETEEGQRWAESRIKALTGGDAISARFMRQDFFTFEPAFKLIIAGNHKPSLRNVDEAVRRRFNLVPFTVTIPKAERDPNLPEKLVAEWPGILAWAIEGCLEWQRIGLAPPPAVLDATEEYLADEDAIGRFLDERCATSDLFAIEEVQDLFASWRDWCATTGEYAGTVRRFSQNLEARHFARERHPVSRRKAFRGSGSSAMLVEADDAWRRGIRPEPPITVSEWADKHRVLPTTSAEPGRWRTSRTPYLRAVMDALSASSPFERVVLMKGAQTGGTEAGLNWLGYIIQNAPGIVMMVQPSLDMVRRNTTVRIDPLIEATPALRELVAPPRSRDAGNSLFRKSFPGGQLVMTGANSPVGLRSTPVRYLFLDEVDGYPGDADGEGDPVDLAIQRTATFRGRRKIYMVSTPTLKGYSRIEAAFAESDQRYFHVPCLACGDMAPITWARIRWPEGRRADAWLVCEACGGVHHEHDKPRLLEAGEWRATAPGDGRTAGFHLSALYSPWETWAEIAIEHGRVMKDPPRLQVWVNTKLGESWEDQAGDTVPADPLMARREDWGEALPASVAVLTAGVDVQGDRIEVQVVGWGRDEEAWVIDYRVLWGDPSGPRLWSDVDLVLQATFPHPAVPDLPVRAVCVDTGGNHTKMAYEFCRTRLARRVWAIKGRGGVGVPVWPRRPTRSNKGKIPLFIVGVDAVKDAVYARLKLAEPGPGAIHFPRRLDAEYFRQLTAERVVTRFERGRPIRSWQPKRDGERNEALDTFVYAHAALHGLISMGLRLNDEVEAVASLPVQPGTKPARVIRSTWMR